MKSQTILTQNKIVSRKFEARQPHSCSPLRLSLTRALPGCFHWRGTTMIGEEEFGNHVNLSGG